MKYIHENYVKTFSELPEKVLQFGEGNFLRAFVDWMIELSNRQGGFNGSVVLCQPIAMGRADALNAQRCQYTVMMRGAEEGKAVEKIERITSVSRCINPYQDYESLIQIARSEALQVIVSNTTEAGIAYHEGDMLDQRPPVSYPAKMCAFLYERYKAFSGAPDKGLLILPVELIDNNGHEMHRIVLQYAHEWGLEEAFVNWVENECEFASTLVDRIVTGYPRTQAAQIEERLGYRDDCLVTCEPFNLWVIEVRDIERWRKVFPVDETEAHVIWTNDVTPYKKRKVRILNGAHTGTIPAAVLANFDIVRDVMHDDDFHRFVNRLLLEEVVPTLDLPRDDLLSFAMAVNDRFANPFIDHRLLDIALNSCSKFNARCLPTLLAFEQMNGKLPARMTFALAAFILFYRGMNEDGKLTGVREDGTTYEIRDDAAVKEFFVKAWESGDARHAAHSVLSNVSFWSGKDLTEVPELENRVVAYLNGMMKNGVRETIRALEYE